MIFARRILQPTVLFALALMAVIVMMILPVPSFVVDPRACRPPSGLRS